VGDEKKQQAVKAKLIDVPVVSIPVLLSARCEFCRNNWIVLKISAHGFAQFFGLHPYALALGMRSPLIGHAWEPRS